MDETIEKVIQNGFAIAVASYLLLKTDKRIEELKDAVLHLAKVIEAGKEQGEKAGAGISSLRGPPEKQGY